MQYVNNMMLLMINSVVNNYSMIYRYKYKYYLSLTCLMSKVFCYVTIYD